MQEAITNDMAFIFVHSCKNFCQTFTMHKTRMFAEAIDFVNCLPHPKNFSLITFCVYVLIRMEICIISNVFVSADLHNNTKYHSLCVKIIKIF